MNNKQEQDVGYYSPEAQTWVKPLCDLRSETSSCARTPTEGSDGFLHRQLARQAWVAPARDRSQIGSSLTFGGLPPGERLTFGSLTFTADGAGPVDINPPAHPDRTIYIGTVAFITNDHGDLRMCLPPIQHIAQTHPSSTTPSSPPASSSEEGGITTAWVVPARASGARRYSNLARFHQPTPTSHFVAMICDNCFITHTPENCVIDGSDSDEDTNIVNIVSLSDGEGSEEGIISVIDDDEYAGPHTIPGAPGSWGESEPFEETGDSQTATDETLPPSTTQAVSLQQVMMMEPVVATTAAASQAPPTTTTVTATAGLQAPPALRPQAVTMQAATTPIVTS